MKKITERQFDFIPKKKWEILSKKDRDSLRDYRRTYRWYKENDDDYVEDYSYSCYPSWERSLKENKK